MQTGAMLARRRFESGGSDLKSSIYLSNQDHKSGQLHVPSSAGTSSGILLTSATGKPESVRYSFAETVEISEEDDSDEDSYNLSGYHNEIGNRN